MEWWQTLLMGGASCLITLIVTFIFNYVTNRPKKVKQARQEELNKLRDELKQAVQEVKNEASKQSDDCQKDHQCLAKIVGGIQKTNLAQNAGLQAVLKDLLKIRYLEWLEKGYAPMDARDDLEKMYQAYHNLGRNGVMDSLRAKFLKLPICNPEEENCDDKAK